MAKLLMISGDRALVEGKHGAFYNTLEEFHKYWDRVDIICPPISNFQFKIFNQFPIFNFLKPKTYNLKPVTYFNNVFIHPSPWPLFMQSCWIYKKGKEIYKEQKFDLVTVHEYPPFYNGIGARLLWQKIRVPYILEIHHIPGYPVAADFKEKVYRMFARCFIKIDSLKAKAIRVVNQSQTSEFLIKSGVPREKIAYIPSMYIDLEVFKPMDLSKEYDLIFIGRLEKNKGIDLLLKAIEFLIFGFDKLTVPRNLRDNLKFFSLREISRRETIKCLIVGSGPLKENLKLKIKNLKLQDNVLLFGWAKDSLEIAELINKSKILVMPSYNEGGPRVMLEAMACEVPVVATNVGLAPDLIKDGKSGSIVDWSAYDIAEKISELLKNQDKQRIYGQDGLKIAERFEKKSAIKNYADKLKEILG